jgi:drug/metabolite transporter (DMT)-like permease
MKHVFTQVDFWSGYVFFSTGMVLAGMFFMVTFKKGRLFVGEFQSSFTKWIWVFVVAELLNIAAEIIQNLAISRGPVALVRVLEGVQPIYVLLIAVIFFPVFPQFLREATYKGRTKKLSLMALMLVGLYLIHSTSA